MAAATLSEIVARIEATKARLDALRPRAPLFNLDHSHDLELTYTSNAIEGNTLTAAETTLVIEQGITIAGKPLKDHLKAIDHHGAIQYAQDIARQTAPLTEMDLGSLHRLVLLRSRPQIAGRYAGQGRYVLTDTGRHAFPSPAEIPALMGEFAGWLATAPDTPQAAFDAHRHLVDIHPFDDGSGCTARLLMILILIRGSYPPVAVRPEDRRAYTIGLQQGQSGHGSDAFDLLLYGRLDATLQEHLGAALQSG